MKQRPCLCFSQKLDVIQNHFKHGDFKKGLIDGILKAGEELKDHFPWQIDDEDELSNEISKG